jgi:YD repeat-containing protein
MARYTYTPGGRLATIESGNGIITRYTYDGEGNLSGLSVQKGEAWLLYAAAFTYDLRGNRLTKRGQRLGEGGRREKTHYHYDLLNRQVRVEGPEGRSTESHYDGEGLRAGLTTGKGESYTFLYHQGELMGEEGKEASGGGT